MWWSFFGALSKDYPLSISMIFRINASGLGFTISALKRLKSYLTDIARSKRFVFNISRALV